MTVSECLTNMLAGRQADEKVSAPLLSPPAPGINTVRSSPADELPLDRKRSVLGRQRTERSLHKAVIWPAFGERLARNLVLLAIGCAVIAAIYTIALHKPVTRPQVTFMGSPTPEVAPAALRRPTPLVVAEAPTPTPTAPPPVAAAETPAPPSPVTLAVTPAAQAAPTPADLGQDIHDKTVRSKRSSHNATSGHGQTPPPKVERRAQNPER
jgi:hypothetical protein